MASIWGTVYYDPSREKSGENSTPIPGVVVTLISEEQQSYVVGKTDSDGSFSFEDIDPGNYRLVETFDDDGTDIETGEIIVGVDDWAPLPDDGISASIPSIEFLNETLSLEIPVDTSTIVAISPTTFTVEALEDNIYENNNFYQAYTTHSAIDTSNLTIVSDNLIENAYQGTFGLMDQGSNANSILPYSDEIENIGSSMVYNADINLNNDTTLADGEWCVVNIFDNTDYWPICDRNEKNEMGAIAVINPDAVKSTIFSTTIDVEPNSNYFLSAWVCNLTVSDTASSNKILLNVKSGDEILHEDGDLDFSLLSSEVSPIWIQIGSNVYTKDYTSLTFEIKSDNAAQKVNSFALDEVTIQKIELPEITPTIESSVDIITPDKEFTYTVKIKNDNPVQPMKEISFTKALSENLSVVVGSVYVNDVLKSTATLQNAYSLSDLSAGGEHEIRFNAIYSTDDENVENSLTRETTAVDATATFDYTFNPIAGGLNVMYSVSNTNSIEVNDIEPEFATDFTDFINDTLVNLDCESLPSSINDAIDEFKSLLIDRKSYIDTQIALHSDLSACTLEKLNAYSELLASLVEISSLISVSELTTADTFASIITLLLNTSIYLVVTVEMIDLIFNYTMFCEPFRDKLLTLLEEEFGHKLMCLFKIVCEWKEFLLELVKKITLPSSILPSCIEEDTHKPCDCNPDSSCSSSLIPNVGHSNQIPNYGMSCSNQSINPYSYKYTPRNKFSL
ncbi:MAG: carboxypeptidase-like regulatory domain-containing protein [Peptostreptococcaceae bacterium]